MTDRILLDLRRAAEVVGVKYRTLRNYHQIAERNRRLAELHSDPSYIRPGDFPPPDDRYGRAPVWKLSTIEKFIQSRPGRGARSDRKPK